MPSDAHSQDNNQLPRKPRTAFIDRCFRLLTLLLALAVPLILLVLGYSLCLAAFPSMRAFGVHFLTTSIWDAVHDHYAVLFAIYGTVVTSLLALILAVPVSLGTAIFLAELAPRWLSEPLSFMVELLAAIPSIIYGMWGIFVLCPLIRAFEQWLQDSFGTTSYFSGPPLGLGMLAAGVVLAIMILPYITAVSREVIKTVPLAQREAAYALGATRWEVIRGPILRYVRSGILGAIILGLGRALGETMAVTMVIGNVNKIPRIAEALFSQGNTMPSLLANEFNEATEKLHVSSLIEVALVLVVITIIVNGSARMLIWSVSKNDRHGVRQ